MDEAYEELYSFKAGKYQMLSFHSSIFLLSLILKKSSKSILFYFVSFNLIYLS